MAAVRLDKSVPFLGRDALLRQQELGVRKRLATLALDDPDAFPWGGEAILRDGRDVGEVTSAGYSARLRRAIVMGYVRADRAIDPAYVQEGRYEIDIAGKRFAAKTLAKPVYPWR
jgi:4-methylaminobutanoate oxidase (formaldehyde-forming)